MDRDIAQVLLSSIQQNNLVFLCGAGLSMAPPSSLPSAPKLAEECSRRYDTCGLPLAIPADTRTDLERLATFFLTNNQLDFMINKVVPWDCFCGEPNEGHETIADLITCGASFCAITTNFDVLIEKAAEGLGERTFVAALDADDANVARRYRPLLKIHGCYRSRDYTLWCHDQLDPTRGDPISKTLRQRMGKCRRWLEANLPRRQLVVIGFWSDWEYLNAILLESVRDIHPSGIIVIDRLPEAALHAKAPDLWTWASSLGPNFRHVREKAEVFLCELRELFSRNILSRVLKEASDNDPGICNDFSVVTDCLNALDADDLYAMRRDFAGVPCGQIARWKEPDAGKSGVGTAHLRMLSSGAKLDGPSYVAPGGERVRIVNGRTLPMSKVKVEYSTEIGRTPPDDYVICAAVDSSFGHASIMPKAPASIVRPESTAKWLTVEEASGRGIF